ncbi:MAG: copper resistance protein CopC [Porphyrobacter sp.]|nr:copper resistance protein CopC [Porphyrobacter sp.]
MKLAPLLAAIAIAAAPLAFPAAALARVKVTASSPAQGATVSSARSVTLTFNEAVAPDKAAVSIIMTAMPGMPNHGEMPIRNFTTAWSNDGKTMTLTTAKPLPKGTYDIRWQAAGADGQLMKGTVTFTIG